jgi:hypothetical protein
MKRLDRNVALFSLSALDVLAMSTGVFLLFIVLLMPYYRNSFDLKAAIEGLRKSHAESAAQLHDIQTQVEEETARAEALMAEAQTILAQANALESQVSPRVPTRPTSQAGGQPVVDQVDLVFVIDTTASMTPVIGEIARSTAGIARILERLVPSVRIGIVAYRDTDTGLPPVTMMGLTPTRQELDRVLQFIDNLKSSTSPSKTIQEDLHLGLATAMTMPFRPNAKQTIVVIGDAAAHLPVQSETLMRTRSFVANSERRNISALFVTTLSSLSVGNIDRNFFVQLAQAGKGAMTDHAGSMTESLLLSILAE